MSAIEVKEVSVRYGTVDALDAVDLRVETGEFLTVLGPSGSGKSTLLGVISGLTTPTFGEIRINGADVTHTPSHRRNMGLVFQNYALFPTMTVAQNVAFGLKVRKIPRSEIGAKVADALAMVRLGSLGQRPIGALSGGQQQRVALARALVIRPTVLLLDEPLGALDRKLRQEVQVELRDLQRELGITTVMVTHDQEEALTLSDRIAIVNDGSIEQIGSPDDLYRRPRTPFVASFLGTSNQVEGRIERHGPDWAVVSGGLRMPCREPAEILSAEGSIDRVATLRPESISVSTRDEGAMVRASVRDAIYLGGAIRYHLDLETGHEWIAVSHDASSVIDRGALVHLSWSPESVWLMEPTTFDGRSGPVELVTEGEKV